ncbi:MAG: hypothetical protein HC888_01820 [Candidatus Competibacteraceae bacterium]|nr:hypothetical protein [Candidatus Competibacteraceae bacterium]
MAGSTPTYQLAYFDFGDKLDAPINVRKEIDRFVLVDKQLYGLYSVFGNGVISGWTVEDNGYTAQTGISVRITPGIGIIRNLAAETLYPLSVNSLPPNTIFTIYAILQGNTVRDRKIDFVSSFTELGDFALKLAVIETDSNSILSIDNADRDLIGFANFVREEINKHRHRGTPSKIDLAEETRNQLPGARVEDFDAQKITTGVFSRERIPLLEHDDLRYSGLVSHAGLDSFVKTLTETNRQLLGEIDATNQLKQIIFQKYKDADVDQEMINQLAFIPGVSPESFIDWGATTAYVGLDTRCISGKPPKTGEFLDVLFKNATAFENAHKLVNVGVNNDGNVTLSRDDNAIETIESLRTSRTAT